MRAQHKIATEYPLATACGPQDPSYQDLLIDGSCQSLGMTASPEATSIARALGHEEAADPATRPVPPVFLLGAGFSRAISEVMPTLRELSEMTWNQYNFKEQVAPDLAELLRHDIEEAMSLLLLSKPWIRESEHLRHRALYLELAQVVAEVIHRQETDATAGFAGEAPAWLHTLIRYWHAHRCPVITLNYDTLVERAAREFRPDGPRGESPCSTWHIYPSFLTNAATRSSSVLGATPKETFRLLKLHGSTNWYYSGRESSRGETIYYTSPAGPAEFWQRARVIEEQWDRECVADKYPFIVPPIFDKTPLMTHETVHSIWTDAARALSVAPQVYIIGYSLPKSDRALHYFLKSKINPAARVEIVSRSTDSLSRYKETLPRQNADGRVTQSFSGATPVQDLVASLPAPPPATPPTPTPALPAGLDPSHVVRVRAMQ